MDELVEGLVKSFGRSQEWWLWELGRCGWMIGGGRGGVDGNGGVFLCEVGGT